jgi:hypothetical protein
LLAGRPQQIAAIRSTIGWGIVDWLGFALAALPMTIGRLP